MKQFLIDSATSRAVGVERGQIFSGCKVAARSCFLEGRCGTLVPDIPYLELCTWVGSKAASRRLRSSRCRIFHSLLPSYW